MNRVPVQLANVSAPFPLAERPDLSASGLDAALAAESVRAAHGDPLLFGRALAAGIEFDPASLTDRERALDLVAIAAWRAGALGLRVDALSRLDDLDSAEHRVAAAAALGIGVDLLDEFRRRQRSDRFWWPGRADQRGYVLATGGFRGLGGAWVRPPERVERLPDDGAFAFLVAGSWWRLDSDVWGARLSLLPERPTTTESSDDGVTIVIGPDTHLAWVHVREQE
ncbi:potassium transporter Kef [Microbacterium sp. Leaf320]|uniref:potassium transporter Kef n=1 Tax=Microbacterium sp. Leaf320 TaxID=1736334 RepID=UPI000B1DF25E|nr:potassium transporter Kef [Microbacterium sp. Leaf320]